MWRSFEIQQKKQQQQQKKKENTIQQDLETNYRNTVLNKHIPTALSCAFTKISGLRGCNYHVLHTSAALFSTWSSFLAVNVMSSLFFFSPSKHSIFHGGWIKKMKAVKHDKLFKGRSPQTIRHLSIYPHESTFPSWNVQAPSIWWEVQDRLWCNLRDWWSSRGRVHSYQPWLPPIIQMWNRAEVSRQGLIQLCPSGCEVEDNEALFCYFVEGWKKKICA